jgi:acyl carrier protein
LATTLEEEFSIAIPFNEITMETFSTPTLIQNYIESKLG